jgi:transcriptional regulator with XRE-family HTH domain
MKSEDIKKIRQELGERIRKAREKANLTQQEVAEMADVNISYYAQIERGEVNPSFEKLHSITNALGIKTLDMGLAKKSKPSS